MLKTNLTDKNWQEFIGGYALAFDLTEPAQHEDALIKCRTWLKSKARDNFLLLSDFIPAEQVRDPYKLEICFRLNKKVKM